MDHAHQKRILPVEESRALCDACRNLGRVIAVEARDDWRRLCRLARWLVRRKAKEGERDD